MRLYLTVCGRREQERGVIEGAWRHCESRRHGEVRRGVDFTFERREKGSGGCKLGLLSAMSERCEAFVPESTADKEARYGKFGGHLHPISRWILSMYENPTDTWSFYSSHLDALQERIKMRRLFTSVLPIQDLDAARGNTQFIRQRDYLAEKASVRTLSLSRKGPAAGCERLPPPLPLCLWRARAWPARVRRTAWRACHTLPALHTFLHSTPASLACVQSDARPRFGTLDYMVKQASGGEQAGESSE